MNERQQARRIRRRALKALLCEDLSAQAYRGLLNGTYEIHGDILSIVMARSKTGRALYRSHVCKLETPRAKIQRKLDEDIDKILGLKKPENIVEAYRIAKGLNYAPSYSTIGSNYGLSIQRPSLPIITGTV